MERQTGCHAGCPYISCALSKAKGSVRSTSRPSNSCLFHFTLTFNGPAAAILHQRTRTTKGRDPQLWVTHRRAPWCVNQGLPTEKMQKKEAWKRQPQ